MKIGIDVGGSHIGLGIVNQEGKLIIKKEKDYLLYKKNMSKAVIKNIEELINQILEEKHINISDIESIGIAFPGTISNGVVIKSRKLGIENLKIKEKLEKEYGVPVYAQNDAKCAAIAEKEFGSLKNYDDAIFLIIGTGVGGAVFLNGKLLKPKRYSGFEVGHMVIEKDGKECNCGRKGCFESYASMRKFKEKIQKEFDLPDVDGKNIKEFIIKNKDNTKLENIINTYIEDLSIGVANLINIFEPEAISIGGSFAHYKEILLDRLEKRIIEKQELFNKESMPKLVVAELKNDAGIIGAAMI